MIDIKATFEKFTEQYLRFDPVNPYHHRSDIAAFILLDKLVGGKGDMVAAAEHDEIFLSVDVSELANVASESDIEFLVKCGVRFNSYFEELAMYV